MSIMFYNKPATEWNEALPLGNGSLGAMVYGNVKKELVHLNHDTLWSGKPNMTEKEGAYEAFEEAKRLTFEGKYEEAHQVLSEKFLCGFSQSYLPFGDLHMDFSLDGEVSDYKRSLDLSKALLTVDFSCGDVAYKREFFVSFPDEVLAIRLSADKLGKLNVCLSMDSPLKYTYEVKDNIYALDGECPGVAGSRSADAQKDYLYPVEPENKGVQFKGGMRVLNQGGRQFLTERSCEAVPNDISSSAAQCVCVEGADSVLVLLTIKTSFNGCDKLPAVEGKEYRQAMKNVLDIAAGYSWDELLAHHSADYQPLFEKIRLDLGESGLEHLPTDERLMRYGENKDDISLITLLFDFGRYLTIASSREYSQATNLQGIWNASMMPPWRSNYTVNINTEMNYWPTLMCGLENCYEPLIHFMKERSVTGEHTARHFYHARGFTMHHNSDIWAHTTAVERDAVYGFWHGASGWLCHNLYDYYEYTLDKKYLEETCYPIMKKAAEFYLDLLCDRGDGRLSICPATSPENTFVYADGKKSSVAKYTAMSDCIAYELFENCLKAMEELGILAETDIAFSRELRHALEHMQPITVGSDGRILEWNEEFDEKEITHRHISHLYALHPAHMITPEKTPELAEACRKTLEVRGDDGTGWSLAWKINMYARLNDGNHALQLLEKQLKYIQPTEVKSWRGGGTYPNLFCAHPPFQIDGNFGFVSGILEMLVDVRDGQLCLLPALPDKWKKGSLTGVRVKGGKVLDITWEDGKLKNVKER